MSCRERVLDILFLNLDIFCNFDGSVKSFANSSFYSSFSLLLDDESLDVNLNSFFETPISFYFSKKDLSFSL